MFMKPLSRREQTVWNEHLARCKVIEVTAALLLICESLQRNWIGGQ